MHYHHHSYDSKTSVLDEKEGLGKVYEPQVTIRLLSYLKPYKLQVATAVVTMIVFTLTSVAVPWFVSQAIGYITRGDLNRLYWLMLLFVANALLGWVTNYIQLRAMAHLGQKVLLTLRTQLFDHLQSLSLSFHDRNEVGRIMSRVQNDVIQLQEFLTSGILILGDLLTLGGNNRRSIPDGYTISPHHPSCLASTLLDYGLLAEICLEGIYACQEDYCRSERRPGGKHIRGEGDPKPGKGRCQLSTLQ